MYKVRLWWPMRSGWHAVRGLDDREVDGEKQLGKEMIDE